MHQPFNGHLGDQLIELLGSAEYDTFTIAVAFAKSSGVLRVKEALEKFRASGGKVYVYVGIDLGVTSYEALTALQLCTDSLSVVHAEKSQTFHTKVYQLLGKKKGIIVVGSHNLTGGGLWSNFESSAHIPVDTSKDSDLEILKVQDDYFKSLESLQDSFKKLDSKKDIEVLLEGGYISKEVTQRVNSFKRTVKSKKGERLFGNGISVKVPRVGIQNRQNQEDTANAKKEQVAELLSEHSEILWFETRKLTGGSRNILDLSKKSLVEKGDPSGTPFELDEANFMRGAVEFFGINPENTHIRKDITLNFEGIDFSENTILYPEGDKANGTWRLQIKGVSSTGTPITDYFRTKGEDNYLVNKVVTFTKITEDYYEISVFSNSELEDFKEVSSITARNGRNNRAKYLGLF